MPFSAKSFFLVNGLLYLILNVRSQTHAYDYGYATNVKQYTRKVHLKQGTLQGVVVEPRVNRALPPVEQFLGIPYAAPPTRELRFMPPGSAPSWFGTKIADSFGHVCPQKLPEKSSMAPEREEYFEKLVKYLILHQSEDCLYLNIYAPVQDLENSLPIYPVMVFLHGESFEWNSGKPYDGSVLAAYGKVVVVTLNFRLGVFGFLKTGLGDTAASNFGLVDQVAALLWVQNNIAAFGGNPSLVTLFGHGTGAVCANLLMLSPMVIGEENKLLFKRAILMGGTALADWALAGTPREVTYQVAGSLNCPSSEAELAGCLRTRNSNDIINASATTDYFITRFGPIIDARVIPNNPRHSMTKYSDLFKRFELMYGVTEVESAHLLGPVGLTHGLLEKERDQELKKYFRVRCEYKPELCVARTLQEYVGMTSDFPLDDQAHSSFSGPGLDKAKYARDKLLDMLSDARSVAPMVQMGKLHSIVNPQSYFYVFGHTTSSKEHTRNKSIHGDELPYVFGVPLDGPKFHFTDHYTAHERLFSEVVMTYFTNFAHTGNPNVNRRTEFYTLNPIDWLKFDVEWPEYDIENEAYLYLAIPPQVRYRYRDKEVRYWNEVLPNLLRDSTANYNYYHPKPTIKPSKTAPSWLDPKPISKATATNYDAFSNFHKPRTRPTEIYGKVEYNPRATSAPHNIMGNIEYGTIITVAPETDAKSGSATTLLVIVGCLFLLVNIFVFAGLYYKCVRLKNKEKKRREEYGVAAIEAIDEKLPKVSEDASPLDGCNLMRMISKSSKSEDIYEAVKVSEDGSNNRFKLMRQMSSSTIDPHTKVRDWIAHEIVQRCSPRFLRRTRQQLAEEHKVMQQKQQENKKPDTNAPECITVGSNSTLGQSPTRPVSPEDKSASVEAKEIKDNKNDLDKPSGIPLPKAVPASRRTAKVSVAIDATPAGRGSSVMRQQPIELTKSLDYHYLGPEQEPQLRRSFTMDDVLNLPSESDNLRRTSTSINLKYPRLANQYGTGGLRIQHSHSKSDPVQDMYKPSSTVNTLPRKLTTFDPEQEVNVTCRDESADKLQPLTPEQQLLTIKRRNFPKVLPDFPHATREALANKRRSMPAQGYLNLPIPEVSSFSQPTSPTGKANSRLPPPAPPPRTTSTLARKANGQRVCQTPAALAEEPPLPAEPEVTFNNLYIGPLIPSSGAVKKPDNAINFYKQNIQQIYDHLRPPKTPEQAQEKREPKTVVTTDSEHPVKRIEPKVVIKPTISKKSSELSSKIGARVIARNSSEEKFEMGKTSGTVPRVTTTEPAKEQESKSNQSEIKSAVLLKETSGAVKLQKPSQIPTLAKTSGSLPKKESSSSESTPSEESDTGTVVKRV